MTVGAGAGAATEATAADAEAAAMVIEATDAVGAAGRVTATAAARGGGAVTVTAETHIGRSREARTDVTIRADPSVAIAGAVAETAPREAIGAGTGGLEVRARLFTAAARQPRTARKATRMKSYTSPGRRVS